MKPSSKSLPSPLSLPLPLPLAIALICSGQAFAQSQSSTATPSADIPAVTVTAPRLQAGQLQSSVGGVSEAPIEVTPQSISVITNKEMRETGAFSLSTLIRSEPSISDSYNTVGYIESLSIRGFLLDNALNYRRDGMAFSNHSPFAIENKERVEVLKGVSGLQAGVSAPGGLVNYVLKRPTNTPLREITLRVSERGTVGVAGDLGGRTDDKSFGYRINVASEERRPMANNAPGNKQFVSGFFDYRLPNQGIVEFELEHQRSKQVSVPGFGLLAINGSSVGNFLPPVINPRTNLNSQPWTQPFESISTVASLRYEQPLNENWKAGVRYGIQKILTNDRLAFPDGCGAVYPGLCSNYDVDLYDFRSENERRRLNTGDLYLKGDVQLAGMKHEINTSIRSSTYSERYEPKQAYNYVGTINVLAPIAVPGDGSKNDKNTLIDSRSKEFSISDAITLNSQWSLWAGLRHTQYDRSSVRTDGSRPTHLNQSFTTPWVGAGYKPWAGGFAYVSAGQGVESEVVPNRVSAFTNAGQVLAAAKSKQIEIGFKQVVQSNPGEMIGFKGLATAALFQIEKPFSDDVVLPGDTLPTRVASGRMAKHRGLELGYSGAVAKDWYASINATAIDARQVRDINNLYNGQRTTNVAPLSIAASASWQFAEGWSWRNGFSFFSSKPVNRDNTVKLPAGWQLDTAVSYVQRTPSAVLTWRAGIDNLLDRRYWREAPTQYWGGTYIFAAQPRTFRMSVTSSF